MAAAPHAHRELIDMVMAVKESGRVTQLENVSKTKVRGVLALLKHGELLITQGVDGEPVRLFLSRGIDNFGSLRTLHDDFLLRYIAEHHIFIPDVLKAELIWTFSEPERRERLQLMNTFVQQVELFFQEYTYQSTTSSVSSYGKQQNESSSRYSFSFPKSSGDYVESDYGSLHSGYSGISEERSFGVFDFPDLVRGGSNDFNQLCSTSHSSIASLTDERPFGSEMPWGEGLDFLNKDKHQNVSGSKGDVSSSYNFSKNIEENFHWKPSTENEIDFADKSIADSITSLGLGEEDYLSDTGSGRHSSTSRPSQSSEVSATVDLGTLPNAFGNFSLGDGSIYQRSKSSDDKYPQRTAINALPKAVGSIRKQTAYDYDPRNGNSNIFQESYDYDDQHFGMASKEYYPTSYLRNSYLPREPVPPNGYQSHAVRKDKLPSYVHIGKQTTGGYYQPQQTHGQNRSSVELSGGENFSFQSKPAQLEKAANRKSFITRQSNDNWTGYGSVSNHTAVGDLGKNGLGPVDMSTYQDDTYLKSGRDAYHFSGFN